MRRVLLSLSFFTCLLLLTILAMQFINGKLSLIAGGYRWEADLAFLLPVILLAAWILFLTLRWTRLAMHLPKSMRRRKIEARRDKGYALLLEGFTAVAAEDPDTARRLAVKAEHYMQHRPEDPAPLAWLLAAQAEQLAGAPHVAESYYRKMSDHNASAFLGIRGMLLASLTRIAPDYATTPEALREAVQLAERALVLRPATPWLAKLLIELYVKSSRWQDAETLIERARRQKVLNKLEANRHLAIVHYQQAWRLYKDHDPVGALPHAEKAHAERETLEPATELLVDILVRLGEQAKAAKIIEKSWKYHPHPGLVERYLALHADQPSDKRIKLMEKLVKSFSDHRESYIALGRAAMAAGAYEDAIRYFKQALAEKETHQLCRLMAEAVERSGNRNGPTEAMQWKDRAIVAGEDPGWLCGECGAAYTRWQPLCTDCGSFDMISWETHKTH